jgi:hypothetical protein
VSGHYGRCDRCSAADELALEPGADRLICLACYTAIWEPPVRPAADPEAVLASMRFACDWAALQKASNAARRRRLATNGEMQMAGVQGLMFA